MASIGQAQAAAELTEHLVQSASLRPGSRITIAGAGTGQMFDFLDPAVFGPHRLTCADLNPVFLARLRVRLERYGLEAEILEDDIERTALARGPDLLLSTLLLEHIAWLRGVESFARLRPRTCGIVLQENPPNMEFGRHTRPPPAALDCEGRGNRPPDAGAARRSHRGHDREGLPLPGNRSPRSGGWKAAGRLAV
jgi:hypothetical protein